ncbi:MAG: nuclear transport factor 2 family protein [Armatimonadetes bacterium]|nr:nuclear transport factor 2 family protein [Armatimonadota bacterium]
MNKTFLTALAIAVALGAGWLASRPRGTDQQQIQNVLTGLTAAAEKRDIWRTLSHVSRDYKGVGGSYDQVRLILLQTFRDSSSIQIALHPPQISVHADSAVATTDANARITSNSGASAQYAGLVTLRLKREERKRWLIYPVQRWTIISAETKMAIPEF